MTDRPIIFSGPMVRALLDGRKTQTRRLASSPLRKCEPGDRLWVRENFWQRPGEREALWQAANEGFADYHREKGRTLRPSIHMPRWASRLTLIVEEVRFQHLTGVRDEDAFAEGVKLGADGSYWVRGLHPFTTAARTPTLAFARLWDHIHGEGTWDANPYVVALTFRVEHRNIDRPEESADGKTLARLEQ